MTDNRVNGNLDRFINKIVSVFSYKELPKTFAIFYSVGLILFILPLTRALFMAITPLSLLFVNAVLLNLHKKRDRNLYLFIAIVMFVSFFTEVVGVKTGNIFGNYVYLSSLGPKILETPIIIGINWVMLTYCSAAIMHSISKKKISFGKQHNPDNRRSFTNDSLRFYCRVDCPPNENVGI